MTETTPPPMNLPVEPKAAVLVVDDEPGIADSLQKVLEREGLRVITAAGGSQALELLRKEPVAVLLTDLLMPACREWIC
jgi:two-component system response regulator HydG